MRAERLNAMEQYILGKETVSLEELSTQFSVSMNTIRRDVMELLSRGNIRKVYGGVSSTLINRPVGFSGLRFHNALYPSAYRREKRRYRDYPQLDCAVCGLVFVQPEHYCAGRYLRPRHVVLYRYFHTGCPLSPEHSDNLYLCYRRLN